MRINPRLSSCAHGEMHIILHTCLFTYLRRNTESLVSLFYFPTFTHFQISACISSCNIRLKNPGKTPLLLLCCCRLDNETAPNLCPVVCTVPPHAVGLERGERQVPNFHRVTLLCHKVPAGRILVMITHYPTPAFLSGSAAASCYRSRGPRTRLVAPSFADSCSTAATCPL